MEENKEPRDLNSGGECQKWMSATYDNGMYFISNSGILEPLPDDVDDAFEVRSQLQSRYPINYSEERYYK